jgi:phosphoserine phosphatase
MTAPLHLVVSIDEQRMRVLEEGRCVREFVISTAFKGMGFTKDSYRTPTGSFRICGKFGDGEPIGTIFKSRVPVGLWHAGESPDEDLILTRILRLEGLDEENRNTFERCIYIHGTNREDLLGEPAGHGCVRLANEDMIALFDLVTVGSTLEIQPATERRGKLVFLACDSTLSSAEGLDELARMRGAEVFAEVSGLTCAAREGRMPVGDALKLRMARIRPDRAMCEEVARRMADALVPGAVDFLQMAKASGWTPVILSGGLAPVISPLAEALGISHTEAVPVWFREDGSYAGHGDDVPTARSEGKASLIREWKLAMLPHRVAMIGNDLADVQTRPEVDALIGMGHGSDPLGRMAEWDGWFRDFSDSARLLKDMMGGGRICGGATAVAGSHFPPLERESGG